MNIIFPLLSDSNSMITCGSDTLGSEAEESRVVLALHGKLVQAAMFLLVRNKQTR